MVNYAQEKLLIVEDERSIQELYAALMRKNFPAVRVGAVYDGFDAVRYFEHEQPGTVLLDFNLPFLNGLTTCYHLRNLCVDNGWDIPNFIFCTASINTRDRNLISQMRPVLTVLSKPVQNLALVNTLRLAFSDALPQL